MDTIEREISRDIYPMPAFATLTVADLGRTIDWYVNALDFVLLFTMPGPDGTPVVIHLRRWRYQDILVRPGKPPSGGGEWTISVMASIDQLETLAERARAHGGGTVDGPADTPWNTRDLHVTDPDGYTVIYTAQRPEDERDERFTAMMQEQARIQLGE
jgi:uncharacterized glyoxalase superfamily protein PhnB